MEVVTPSEAFETRMAQSSDAVVLRGSFEGGVTLSTSPLQVLVFNPVNFGMRASQLNGIFSKFRYKEVRIDFMASNPASAGIAAFGILDDTTGEGDGPTSLSGVKELRCSAVNWFEQTTPTSFVWKPNSQNWMYSYQASGDARFTNSAIMYAACTGATNAYYTISFTIVFKGAVDTGSQVSIQEPPVLISIPTAKTTPQPPNPSRR
jgi:hypothetical protein